MPRIRKVEIANFRGIKSLSWLPGNGVNCLIGPGDSCKSTILDAIDLCLGARRNLQITDADFHLMDVEQPIEITLTIGALDDALKNLDTYGLFLRGFVASTGEVLDEPEKDAETVLSLRLRVESDLEPSWKLYSERAASQESERNLSWADRARLSPTRIGSLAEMNLAWRKGSVLNRLSEERADASAAITKAARDARATFGESAKTQLGEALKIAKSTASGLGIDVGDEVKAMLDAHSVSVSGGTISLHNEAGIPLRNLGTGSTRLLIAGLQHKAAEASSILLVDELEHGLEPHRIMRFIDSLGAKETSEPLQAFVTTHSPIALRELNGSQLYVVRASGDQHQVQCVGTGNDTQGTIRKHPEAFLARSVIVCEGATEVGFIRGIDRYDQAQGHESLQALAVALVDAGGGSANDPYKRAMPFLNLGYRTAILRDDDKQPDNAVEQAFAASGGKVFTWSDGCCLEAELFNSLTEDAVMKLLQRAVEIQGEDVVGGHIQDFSTNGETLATLQCADIMDGFNAESRALLGKASSIRKKGWFKQLGWMEEAAYDIVGPDLAKADKSFKDRVTSVFEWVENA